MQIGAQHWAVAITLEDLLGFQSFMSALGRPRTWRRTDYRLWYTLKTSQPSRSEH